MVWTNQVDNFQPPLETIHYIELIHYWSCWGVLNYFNILDTRQLLTSIPTFAIIKVNSIAH